MRNVILFLLFVFFLSPLATQAQDLTEQPMKAKITFRVLDVKESMIKIEKIGYLALPTRLTVKVALLSADDDAKKKSPKTWLWLQDNAREIDIQNFLSFSQTNVLKALLKGRKKEATFEATIQAHVTFSENGKDAFYGANLTELGTK
ncbi:MAG: hypothetical protein HQM10_12940 [Candidatus Riflebacteria bacterium]|nr:hypothetical protein [Candidatus Riflebacteria bacterium]